MLSLYVHYWKRRVLAVWHRANSVRHINKVALRWARLVLGWVTVYGFNYQCGKFMSI